MPSHSPPVACDVEYIDTTSVKEELPIESFIQHDPQTVSSGVQSNPFEHSFPIDTLNKSYGPLNLYPSANPDPSEFEIEIMRCDKLKKELSDKAAESKVLSIVTQIRFSYDTDA